MKTNYSDRWPVAYRTQDEAGIPPGMFYEVETDDRSKDHLDWFAIGFGLGLLLGLGLVDLLDSAARWIA